MMTKIKLQVIGILCTMINEDLIFIQYCLKISLNWGQTFNQTADSPFILLFFKQLFSDAFLMINLNFSVSCRVLRKIQSLHFLATCKY